MTGQKPQVGRLHMLEEARDRLRAAIVECASDRELPALARELRLTLAEIDGLGAGKESGDVVDQLAKRRSTKAEKGA